MTHIISILLIVINILNIKVNIINLSIIFGAAVPWCLWPQAHQLRVVVGSASHPRAPPCLWPAQLTLCCVDSFDHREALTRPAAGALPSPSGVTAGPSPRLSLRPLNISTSQVRYGAGAHPVPV